MHTGGPNTIMMQQDASQAAWGTGAVDMRPIVTLSMLQCQMCTNRFSMSGKLSDHRTPVLAVNPSHSIEGPYCISCAGTRDGLRSFQIDEARVALCKLWHQQVGAAYAQAAAFHQQHHQMAAQQQQQANPPVSSVAADINRRMAAKQDAPGLINSHKRRPVQNEETALAMPPTQQLDEHTTYAGYQYHPQAQALAQQLQQLPPPPPTNKRPKTTGACKTTWTDEEDAILSQAVTTSTEQPFTRWSDLAHQLPGRVGKQIRDRWLNHLDPRIDRSPFSPEEDETLYNAYKKHGKRWVEISTKFFDGKRSENHVKNRWYSAAFKKFVKQEMGEDPFENNPQAAKKKQQLLEEPQVGIAEEKKEE